MEGASQEDELRLVIRCRNDAQSHRGIVVMPGHRRAIARVG